MFGDLFKILKSLFPGANTFDRDTARREKIILEYKNKQPLYEAFSLVMKKLIEALLVQGKYKYQLSVRVKDVKRLEEKIERKQNLGAKYKRLSDIEDMVGVRIIFYTENDKEAFIKDLKNEVYLKAKGEFAQKLASLGWVKFNYKKTNGQVVSMSYWRVPDELMDDQEMFTNIAKEALFLV